jgi:biopolymer transport protein TolR
MAFGIDFGESPDDRVLADINVTPLVDVMLVLLIIFMITAPMLHQGIEVVLPEADAEFIPQKDDDPLILSINRDGVIFLQDEPVHTTQLLERLTPQLAARQGQAVYIKGDRELSYGKVIEVLDILQGGGITQINMVTDKRQGSGR